MKLGLPGKSILGDYFQENGTSRRPLLLLRISFPRRPIFITIAPRVLKKLSGGPKRNKVASDQKKKEERICRYDNYAFIIFNALFIVFCEVYGVICLSH